MIYIALLRGINVGGNNKVDMKKLKATFKSLGYTSVVTYINSGNIIFEDSLKSPEFIVDELEKSIKRDFNLEIKVLIRDFLNIKNLCNELPATWLKNEQMRTDVMFLWDKYDRPEITEQLKISMVDHVKYFPGAILWNVEGENYSKSGMLKLMGTALYKNMTIRNVNTVRSLCQIMADIYNKNTNRQVE